MFSFVLCKVQTLLSPGGGEGGEVHMKLTEIVVVSLRGGEVRGSSHGMCSRVSCSGQNTIFLAVMVSLRAAHEEI